MVKLNKLWFAAAEELSAKKIELLDEKYALEERIKGLILDGDTKDEKIARLENDALLKDKKVAGLENSALLKDQKVARLKADILLKDGQIAHLKQNLLLDNDNFQKHESAFSLEDKRLLYQKGKIPELKFGEKPMQGIQLKGLEA